MSGGKDSFFSALIAIDQGFDVRKAIIVIPEEYSFMFHFPNIRMASYPASLLGIEPEFVDEGDFEGIFLKLRAEGYGAIISGAVASEYQKTRIEKLCTEYGIVSFTPLWMINQEREIEGILESGIRSMIVSVSADGLTEDDLGKELDYGYLQHLKSLGKRYGININGEGGEYETFVYGFGKKSCSVSGEKIWKGSGGYFMIKDIKTMTG